MWRPALLVSVTLLQLTTVFSSEEAVKPRQRSKRQISTRGVPCLRDVGFYRRPIRDFDIVDPVTQCTEFFQCINGIVLASDCGKQRRFDVWSQQCNYKKDVNKTNCDIISRVGRPALDKAGCPTGQLGCFSKDCISSDKFCDGNNDCADGSDEAYCSINEDPNAAEKCDEKNCVLPNCFCSSSGAKVPGDLDPKSVPQMIMISFDDAVNSNVQPIYDALFTPERKNPNGCPIRGSFYLAHQWTDYRLVQQLYRDGHDVMLHSTSHKKPESYWDTGDITRTYTNEFITNRKIVKEFAQFPDENYFQGMRVPWLKLGGNRQFQFMRANNILFDHTMSAPPSSVKYWPYTLDYRMPHKCYSSNDQSCPTRRFPGSWAFVINQINGSIEEGPSKGQYFCAMMESCPSRDYDSMLTLLRNNFKDHYNGNRAPLGLFFHARWFIDEGHFPALQSFIEEVLANHTDVYFVTAYQALNWIRNPVAVNGNNRISAFDCPQRTDVPEVCPAESAPCSELPPISPTTPSGQFFTCRPSTQPGVHRCPQYYPWIGNWMGDANTNDTTIPLGTGSAPAPVVIQQQIVPIAAPPRSLNRRLTTSTTTTTAAPVAEA
ncbi:hypothetical protein BV898_06377 [Hypsibius exemplaris]|uniref:Chitin-binding type-2 domain-containing protein n=1 Tax=Hypsibius exemplaris TaxID=2072580 RepID=A0A1W0WWN6_HYPEX|nr:hypothetical protein BV898_06377 [Hypsibius exemplaris]